MAVMAFREPNRARWVGVRPGHDGTQVVKYARAENATVIIHTVTAGKTLFLCGLMGSVFDNGGGQHTVVFVRDGADVFKYYLYWGENNASAGEPFSKSYWPPIEIPAGYDVCAQSTAAAHYINAIIDGWEDA